VKEGSNIYLYSPQKEHEQHCLWQASPFLSLGKPWLAQQAHYERSSSLLCSICPVPRIGLLHRIGEKEEARKEDNLGGVSFDGGAEKRGPAS